MKGPHHSFVMRDVVALKPSHDRVRALRDRGDEPVEFGSRIWRSSYLLIDYLSRQQFDAGERVLELGCGWALPSQYLQKSRGLRVTATDADHRVREYLNLLSEFNHTEVGFLHRSFAQLSGDDLTGVSTLLGADICYKPANSRDLLALVERFLLHGGHRVILADSGRGSFFQLARQLEGRWPLEIHSLSLRRPAETRGHVLHIGSV